MTIYFQDFFTLHIRAVGGWTNKLYEYYDNQNKEKGSKTDESLYEYYMKYLKAGLDGNVRKGNRDEKLLCELQVDGSALENVQNTNNVSKHPKRAFYCSTPLQVYRNL